MDESRGFKPDWFGEIKYSKLLSIKYSNRLLYIKHSKNFPQMVEILADNSLKPAYHFSCGQEPCLPFSFYGVTTAYPLKPVKKGTHSNFPECLKDFKDTSSLRDSQWSETQNHK